jgi:membrane-bound lytic murein transglycosylase MltF
MCNLEDKICCFNVNEYHLVTILMPYIYEEINEGKNIITIFEKDLVEIYHKVLITNIRYWNEREKFKEIDWKKSEIDKLSEKFKNVENGTIVIVAGKNNYIERINRLILNFHTNFTLVNCFELEYFNEDLKAKVNEYYKLLNTKGIQEIKEKNLI